MPRVNTELSGAASRTAPATAQKSSFDGNRRRQGVEVIIKEFLSKLEGFSSEPDVLKVTEFPQEWCLRVAFTFVQRSYTT